MKTDKSGRFVVTTPEEYLKMGEEHTRKDQEVSAERVTEMENTCNSHSTALNLMLNSGQDHSHTERIVKSKNTKSGKVADLTLLYKDHKAGNKTRPVASGNESYNLGLSNTLSEIMEAVSRSKRTPYSVISSEDLLARKSECNRKVMERKSEWLARRVLKFECEKCEIIEKLHKVEHGNIREECTQMIHDEDYDGLLSYCQKVFECETCEKVCYTEMERNDCDLCGKILTKEEMSITMIGSDVVALYPSIQAKSTGLIVRKSIQETELKFEGFDEKMGLAYIVINKEISSGTSEIEHMLPTRKYKKGSKPTMSSVNLKWDPESQWNFPPVEIGLKEKKIILSIVVEIALITLFQNFTYKFGGVIYHQVEGSPIGVRASGAASELVMQAFSILYQDILTNSGLWTPLLAGYVDDGRQVTSMLKKGMRFSEQSNKFELSVEGLQEDLERAQMGESHGEKCDALSDKDADYFK